MSLSFIAPEPIEIPDDAPVTNRRAGGAPDGVSPGYALQPGEGPARWFMNALFTFKARDLDTDHQFGLNEQYVPRGFGAPAHNHQGTTESFYLIDGRMDFAVGDTVYTDITGGGFVYVPRGPRHEFTPAHVFAAKPRWDARPTNDGTLLPPLNPITSIPPRE